MRLPSEKKLKLRAILRDGAWELETGGAIPVADGTVVEMTVPEKSVTDPHYLKVMKNTSLLNILKRGAK